MSLFTVVGDPHVTPKNTDKALQLFQIVEDLGNPTVFLGDLQDTKEVIRGKVLNLYYDYFKSSKLHHTVLVGNHDWHNLECKDHSLRTFKDLPNVTIVDTFIYNLNQSKVFGYMPYMKDPEILKLWLKQAKEQGVQCLFGHFDIIEFDYGNGRMCEEGLVLKDFKAFDKVISGHFHKYQLKKNLMYLGTPFSHSFGEANQSKFLATIDVDSLEVTLIPTPFPSHVDITIKLDDGSEPIFQQGNYHRAFLKGTNRQIAEFDKSPFKDYDIRWVPQPTDEMDTNKTLEEGGDNKQQFVKWATDIRNLDKETVDLGLEILGGLGVK